MRIQASGEEVATVTGVFTLKAGVVAEVRGYFSDDGLLAEVRAI